MQSAGALLCCHLWPLWQYHIFQHYHTKYIVFEKIKRLKTKRVYVNILKTFSWNISFSTKNSSWYHHKCISVFMWSTGCLHQILKNLEFSRQIFENIWLLNYIIDITVGDQLLHTDGRTDRQQTDLTKIIFSFRNFTKTPKTAHFRDRIFSFL